MGTKILVYYNYFKNIILCYNNYCIKDRQFMEI